MNTDIFTSFDDIFSRFPSSFPNIWTVYTQTKKDPVPEPKDESAWLIESELDAGGPSWWTAHSGWSYDANEAVRFSRKQDAEVVAIYALGKSFASKCKVTEHLWCHTGTKEVKPADPVPVDAELKPTAETVRELCSMIQCLPTDLIKAVAGIRDKQRAAHGQAARLQSELNEIKRKRDDRQHDLAIANDKLDRIAQVLDPLMDR